MSGTSAHFDLSAPLARAAQAVVPAISAAVARTGVDFNALFHTARLESGFNPLAKARTSSATGLFQFTESTWLATLGRHGARLGLTADSRDQALALRKDPAAASLMAAAHMADNAKALQARLGRAVSTVDLYMAHFLGVGGAARFLTTLAEAPSTPAAALLPSAAAANRSIFYEEAAARTVRQVHDLFARRLGAASGEPTATDNAIPGSPAIPAFAGRPPMPFPDADQTFVQARAAGHAARVAYLMLADMGG
jgi:hypothetical protein